MGVVARWRDRLPVTSATPDLTLGEGATPLIAAPVLSAQLDAHVFLKIEAPTRPAASRTVDGGGDGLRRGAGRSRGGLRVDRNTAASAAAYAARAGIEALVLHPAGAVAGAKLAQTRVVGAAVIPVEGTFDDALRLAQEAADHGYVVVNSGYNADRIAGQRRRSTRFVETLGSAPDILALPYGGGGNTVAYRSGFEVEGVVPLIVSGEARERQTTVATAIRIGEPVHASDVADTNAEIVTLSDEEILAAWS